ncbi:MAG: D-aminoacyl-tRNA deacylase [Marinifilaceae bacterium]|jgi:D-tyrosyl-tRNA(Tyr) deacylase|nr:D-aminoacyl-tRNA deacylase [Marinifilaceae bacterium]
MKIVIQRSKKASVSINNEIFSEIGQGILVLVGVEEQDEQDDIDYLVKKLCNLRIFDDENGIMNKSVKDINGDILAISQFTLMARTKKGNRPSYIDAAKPDISIPLYEKFVSSLNKEMNKEVKTGQFGADMQVSLINDGPVTIIIDSKNK